VIVDVCHSEAGPYWPSLNWDVPVFFCGVDASESVDEDVVCVEDEVDGNGVRG
jgi:hypothetical protein